jgi:uncharacterized membrane protein
MRTPVELATHWLKRGPEALGEGERRVLQSMSERKPIARNPAKTYDASLSLGARLADSIARVGGSWSFIIAFLAFLALWTAGNAWMLSRDAFDPYPFIFLNLLLSMLAAIQAPVIMMSQNRQAEHDRIDAEHDYEVNLKAEIEIMALHEKMDELRNTQLVTILERIEKLALQMQELERAHAAAARAIAKGGSRGRGAAER